MKTTEHPVYLPQRIVRHLDRLQVHTRPKSPKIKSNSQAKHHCERAQKKARVVANRQPWVERRLRTSHDRKLKSILKVDGQNRRNETRTIDLVLDTTKRANRSVKFNYHAMLRRFASELSNPFEGIVYDDKMIPVRQEERSPGRLMAKARRNRKGASEIPCAEKHFERHHPLYRIPNNAMPRSVRLYSTNFVPSRESVRLLAMLHKIECRQYTSKHKRIPRVVKGGVPHSLAILATCERGDGPTIVFINESPQTTLTMVSLNDLPEECLVLPLLPEERVQKEDPVIDEFFEEWLKGVKMKKTAEMSKSVSKIRECKAID